MASQQESVTNGEESKAKVFTLEEVAKHATADDMWLVIHNKIYDVTSFVDEHPGGVEVLLETAGMESTYAFEDVGHSLDARDLLNQYYIAELHKDDHTQGFTDGTQVTSSDGSGSGLSSGVLLGIGAAVAAAISFYVFNRI